MKKAQERIIQEGEARLELERSLRQSEKLATMGQLASGLAHEIGTPLNIISGRAELTRKKPDDRGGVQKNQDMILAKQKGLQESFNNSSGLSGRRGPSRNLMKIHELLETTLDFLSHQIEKKGVKVA